MNQLEMLILKEATDIVMLTILGLITIIALYIIFINKIKNK